METKKRNTEAKRVLNSVVEHFISRWSLFFKEGAGIKIENVDMSNDK